jgi:hypothetical protein
MTDDRNRVDLFKVKFYRWAHTQFEREVQSGYPLIRQVLSIHVDSFLRLAKGVSVPEQLVLASGLTKRFHLDAVQQLGDLIQPQEQELVHALLNSDFRIRERPKTWSRAEMRNLLGTVARQVYGVENCEWGRGECDFTIHIGDWQVRTFLDTHTFAAKFTYSHALSYAGQEMEPMTSVLNWFGICGGGSSWDAAETPSQVIPGFMAASKLLLDALPLLSPD